MPRNLPAAVKTETAKRVTQPFNLVDLLFSTPSYLTDGARDVSYNGQTYLADGNLQRIGDITEALELRTGSMTVTLSGVAQANIATALLENYLGRSIIIRRAFFLDGALVVDPFTVGEFIVSSYEIREDPRQGTATVSWQAASYLEDFQRTAGRRTNDNDQQALFPGDRGFEFAADVVKDIKWGKA